MCVVWILTLYPNSAYNLWKRQDRFLCHTIWQLIMHLLLIIIQLIDSLNPPNQIVTINIATQLTLKLTKISYPSWCVSIQWIIQSLKREIRLHREREGEDKWCVWGRDIDKRVWLGLGLRFIYENIFGFMKLIYFLICGKILCKHFSNF